jgi:Tfp pilus assembly protein PilN
MYNINFFGRAGDLYQRTRKKDQKFLNWSLLGFGSSLAIFVIILGLNLWLGQQLSGIAREQNQTKQALVGNQSVELSYLIFTNKLKAIVEIFDQRNNKQQAINYLSNLFGEAVFINGVAYDGVAQVLSLSLTSSNIFDLEKLLNSLDTPDVRENFSSLTKSNIKRNEDGSYNLRLTLELKKSKGIDNQIKVDQIEK